jgi:hypothetical protein
MNAQAMQAIEGRRDRLNVAMLGTRRLETSGASVRSPERASPEEPSATCAHLALD